MALTPTTVLLIAVKLGPGERVEAGDLQLFSMTVNRSTGASFEYGTPLPGFIGSYAGDVDVYRPIVARLEILDMLQGRTCVCGAEKARMRSHCRECYFCLPPEMRQALYRGFGKGYEPAFLDSLAFLLGRNKTDHEKIRAAVPVPKKEVTK